MTQLAFPLHRPTLIPVDRSDVHFPVRRIYCVGQNYRDHVSEMGGDPKREAPFFFSKPRDAVVASGSTIPFPPATRNLHHEAELCVAIGRTASDVTAEDAPALIYGYAAANDLTRRDLQAEAKAGRRPWDMAKGFDNSAVIAPLTRVQHAGDMTRARITCTVDDEIRQDGDIADMIWPVPDIIAFLNRLVTLKPGDLILTGTPAGVGPIEPGQRCVVAIEGLHPASIKFEA